MVRFLWLGAQEGYETVRCDAFGVATVTTEPADISEQDSVVIVQSVYGTHAGHNLFFDWRATGMRSIRVRAARH